MHYTEEKSINYVRFFCVNRGDVRALEHCLRKYEEYKSFKGITR